ncbi:MAG: beta-L-arabinofuranosidase domain-containing protein [Bryobacteraceae bacterium]
MPYRAAICLLLLSAFSAAQPVIDTSHSPHANLRGFPVKSVTLEQGFWTQRRAVNVETSIPTMLQLLEEHGIVDNFRRLSGRKSVARKGPLYTDSDLYKWLEAVAFVLQSEERPELRRQAANIIDDIVAAQEPSGYLNTYYQDERKDLRFTEMNRGHELYCLGHLLQAAIAWQRATGDRKLLGAGIRFVDYLVANFGPDKRPLLAGHPEIELALTELYRVTGNKNYLTLAGYILTGDGERLNLTPRDLTYMFSGKPFTTRTHLEGHAVRAMYACSGATDYYMETGDPTYKKTLDTLWEDMTRRKMYLTGGVGSRASGEAFGEPYELPNQLAYTESCAAIAIAFWNWRMLQATADARYTDIFERALYNGANSGVSISGTLYCYRNPLEMTGDPSDKIRNPWYDTTCCPPNIQRILASLPGYLYGESDEGLYVHLYHANQFDWRGTKVTQRTKYPWEGAVEITVDPPSPREFTLFVRVPDWSAATTITVDGEAVTAVPGAYVPIRRTWKKGDTVKLNLDMTPRLIAANPRVRDDVGKAAVMRGPLVYCMEGLDQGGIDLADIGLSSFNDFRKEWRPNLLGGVMVLKHLGAQAVKTSAGDALYHPLQKRATRRADIVLIPYYTFANREPTPMQVWIPYE